MIKKRQDILRALLEKLHDALKEMHSERNFPFGDYLLSHQQAVILFYIAEKENGLPVKELTKLMHVTPGAITQFIDSLVKKKLVEREIGKPDRRSINIKLTPPTKKAFAKFKRNYFIQASQVFNDFTLDDLEQFSSLLGKIKTLKKNK